MNGSPWPPGAKDSKFPEIVTEEDDGRVFFLLRAALTLAVPNDWFSADVRRWRY
jgi:hypothetical protein